MSDTSDTEKTEPATPRKREKVRDQGNVAQSREVPSAAVLGIALLVFTIGGGWFWEHLADMFLAPFRLIGQLEVSTDTLRTITGSVAGKVSIFLLPLLIGVVVAGVAANVAQVGVLVAREALLPKIEKLNPVNGFKNMFSLRSLVEAIKSILKIAIVGAVVWSVVDDELENILNLTRMPAAAIFSFLMSLIARITFRAVLALIAVAILDYAFQRYDWEKKNRMSKNELKDEFRQMEGDPKIKARIRAVQREIAMRRMMQEVPKADVVITNPTELALALRYEEGGDLAPRVVAKGKGVIARKIRELAIAHGVPVLERRELAQELYKVVKLNQTIPAHLYQAMAEILAYVYGLKERRSS